MIKIHYSKILTMTGKAQVITLKVRSIGKK